MNENLIWVAKRLADIAKDIDELEDHEKKHIIERAEKLNPISLVKLYNALGEHGEL